MAKRRIGALITIEQETGIDDYAETGTPIDGVLTSQLLTNIFTPNTPLHDGAVIIKQNKIKSEKIDAVVKYVRNKSICRSCYLLAYFGEKNNKNCGICDVCIKVNKKSRPYGHEQLSQNILTLLSSHDSLSSKEIISHFNLDSSVILSTLQLLLDSNKITITSQNKLEIISNE